MVAPSSPSCSRTRQSPGLLDLAHGRQLAERTRLALGTLTPRDSHVLSLRFGIDDYIPRTLQGVASHYNPTRERIRQIAAAALQKLGRGSRAGLLREFSEDP